MPQYDPRGIDLREKKSKEHPNPTGKSWFFGIGIDNYQEFPPLSNAVKDVNDLLSLLQTEYDIDPEQTITLFNEAASEENIIDKLDELVHQVGENDKLIIYYSGHGHLDKQTGLGFWIPFDAKKDKTSLYIRNSTILDYIKVIPCRHILLVSDSCFSGSLFVRSATRNAAPEELETIPSRWALCSGRHNEEVFDGEPGKNSPFAESILDTLRSNTQRKLNIARLADRVIEQTRANYHQLPEGNPLHGVGHKGGQYVFQLKAPEAEDWAKCLSENTPDAFRHFLEKYPNGQFAAQAKTSLSFMEEASAWEQAKKSNTLLAFYEFSRQFPKGTYAAQALEALKLLEEGEAWKDAHDKNTLYALKKYSLDYPDGRYKARAEEQMEALARSLAGHAPPPPPETRSEKPAPEIPVGAVPEKKPASPPADAKSEAGFPEQKTREKIKPIQAKEKKAAEPTGTFSASSTQSGEGGFDPGWGKYLFVGGLSAMGIVNVLGYGVNILLVQVYGFFFFLSALSLLFGRNKKYQVITLCFVLIAGMVTLFRYAGFFAFVNQFALLGGTLFFLPDVLERKIFLNQRLSVVLFASPLIVLGLLQLSQPFPYLPMLYNYFHGAMLIASGTMILSGKFDRSGAYLLIFSLLLLNLVFILPQIIQSSYWYTSWVFNLFRDLALTGAALIFIRNYSKEKRLFGWKKPS